MVCLTGLLAALPVGPDRTALADLNCSPGEARRVNVLARPAAGLAFTSVAQIGGTPFLDTQSSTTYVPVRSLVSIIAAGEGGGTRWDEQTRTATFSRAGRTISFSIPPGTNRAERATVNGERVAVTSFICNGRLYAPARFVAASLGVELKWYADGTVVVDPAWQPSVPSGISDAPPDSHVRLPRAEQNRPASPADTSQCSAWLSPAEAPRNPVDLYWRATRSAACQILRGASPS
ncbi:MAG: copper amine oxidase N-terminal domain-containing protein [Pseudarthrobacter sp.]